MTTNMDATLPPPPSQNLNDATGTSELFVTELSRVFKLLADETRLRILMYLADSGELNVTELCERLGQSQPAVSHHLALMRVAGLIAPRRNGKHNYYSVREEHFLELMHTLAPSASGNSRRLKFHDFVLSYEGE
jgi:DNA-binding transcriptional ArsR family regulator